MWKLWIQRDNCAHIFEISHNLKIIFKNVTITRDSICLFPGSSRLQVTQTRPRTPPFCHPANIVGHLLYVRNVQTCQGAGNKDTIMEKVEKFSYLERKPSEPLPN